MRTLVLSLLPERLEEAWAEECQRCHVCAGCLGWSAQWPVRLASRQAPARWRPANWLRVTGAACPLGSPAKASSTAAPGYLHASSLLLASPLLTTALCLSLPLPACSDEPLVSCDYRMTNVSSTIDAALTMVMGDDMVKVRARAQQTHLPLDWQLAGCS